MRCQREARILQRIRLQVFLLCSSKDFANVPRTWDWIPKEQTNMFGRGNVKVTYHWGCAIPTAFRPHAFVLTVRASSQWSRKRHNVYSLTKKEKCWQLSISHVWRKQLELLKGWGRWMWKLHILHWVRGKMPEGNSLVILKAHVFKSANSSK